MKATVRRATHPVEQIITGPLEYAIEFAFDDLTSAERWREVWKFMEDNCQGRFRVGGQVAWFQLESDSLMVYLHFA